MKSNTQKKTNLESGFNPLDGFERFLRTRKSAYTRPVPEALSLIIEPYTIDLFWNEDDEAIHCSCAMSMQLPEVTRDLAAPVVMHINRRQWLGHFELHEDGTPCFRYTMLFSGVNSMADTDMLYELTDIATRACEQYAPAFELMARATGADNFPRLFDTLGGMEPLALALIDASGQG